MPTENLNERMELEKFIRNIIDENSGGLKYMDLLSQVVRSSHREQADKLEEIISKMEGIKVLNYTWHRLSREKMFIYTP